MFSLEEDNRKIGRYLSERIKEKGFKSNRDFVRAYLDKTGVPTGDEEEQRMANRLSQMLNGNKGIQIYDLPVFTELLGISCEEHHGMHIWEDYVCVRESFDELFRRPFR